MRKSCSKQFIDKFEPKNQRLIRAVRKTLHKRFRTAYELAYDNYNFFVIGRPSDAIVSNLIIRSVSAKQRRRRK